MSFIAPLGYERMYEEILKRCHSYISLEYWDNIDNIKFNKWLDNFKTPEEKYLAALILHKVVYRNKKCILSMLSNIMQIVLPQYLNNKNIFIINNLEEWEGKLYDSSKGFHNVAQFRISTITTGDLGESGHAYMRILREHFVNKHMLCDITSKDLQRSKLSYVKSIVFIDDFIGTGTQINEFLEKNIKSLTLFDNIAIMPLVAHEKGIKSVLSKAKELKLNIEVLPVEYLTYENSYLYYNEDTDYKFDGINTLGDFYTFYQDLVISKKLESNENAFGFGNLGTTHLFSTGVPDNNLPIIYKNITHVWHALQEKR